MMSIAAGMAACGNVVFASSFAMFASGRAFEQIRNSIAYPKLNVKIGATHGGISVGEDGASHQCCEDISLMRTIPNMTVIVPADDTEARLATRAVAQMHGPCYLRFGRLAVPVVFGSDYKFEIGKGVVLSEGTDVTIIANGLMVEKAIDAGKQLAAEGISARVEKSVGICLLDLTGLGSARKIRVEYIQVRDLAAKTGAIVTAEEHSIIGGLGSAVCEVVCEEKPVPVLRVGVNDKFGKSGPAVELLDIFGLSAANIVATAKKAVSLKR